eukprot:m.214191 g.214191  ORF g.214191 m.214191 type:complete len:550 (+) comp19071_c0_seq3:126-1775(+)
MPSIPFDTVVVPDTVEPSCADRKFGYGTAGFRCHASLLSPVMFRVGLLAVLRAIKKNSKIGVMVTASHNPECDNGVKIVDPMGEMMEQSWEAYATQLANCPDGELAQVLNSICEQEGIVSSENSDGSATVVIAMDTRPSSAKLLEDVKAGVASIGGTCIDYGLLTTPQLHFMVRCSNDATYGTPTEASYVAKLTGAFEKLCKSAPSDTAKLSVKVDCANGVGAPQFATLATALADSLHVQLFNTGGGVLNENCGADYVKTTQSAAQGMTFADGDQCASFDGDADRLMFFFTQEGGKFCMLDGDRIAILFAVFLQEKLQHAELTHLKLGVVQTAYANGASTRCLGDLGIPVGCAKTGVKHLHHMALEYDVGVYFEANGHGTVLFSDNGRSAIDSAFAGVAQNGTATAKDRALEDLVHIKDLINETVGDAISDLLLVQVALAHRRMQMSDWLGLYTDLPNRLRKVKIADRNIVTTTNAERTCVEPKGLQLAIDEEVAKFEKARSFVRPSGTEDVVRVYAEAATQAQADELAQNVCMKVFELAGGVGDAPQM